MPKSSLPVRTVLAFLALLGCAPPSEEMGFMTSRLDHLGEAGENASLIRFSDGPALQVQLWEVSKTGQILLFETTIERELPDEVRGCILVHILPDGTVELRRLGRHLNWKLPGTKLGPSNLMMRGRGGTFVNDKPIWFSIHGPKLTPDETMQLTLPNSVKDIQKDLGETNTALVITSRKL